MLIEGTVRDLARRRDDMAGDARVEAPVPRVHLRTGALEQAHRVDDLARHALGFLVADREVVQ